MLTPPASFTIYVATQPVDFRNYAEPTIMRSVRPFNPRPASLSTVWFLLPSFSLSII
ncbi:hypothetical protein M2222_009274 [Bradyrhizobium elkanii]|nr:hypothetical protein [Bradyrhizobium elkanii]MCS3566893.1 hypothetical protein [Bradyrhizobium elkanii]MCW2153793.1 hypothetical protein [Bradyrhizobium elkanii]MCW2380376.1 hypothetical protein [Bradyrhizobium elkanii]